MKRTVAGFVCIVVITPFLLFFGLGCGSEQSDLLGTPVLEESSVYIEPAGAEIPDIHLPDSRMKSMAAGEDEPKAFVIYRESIDDITASGYTVMDGRTQIIASGVASSEIGFSVSMVYEETTETAREGMSCMKVRAWDWAKQSNYDSWFANDNYRWNSWAVFSFRMDWGASALDLSDYRNGALHFSARTASGGFMGEIFLSSNGEHGEAIKSDIRVTTEWLDFIIPFEDFIARGESAPLDFTNIDNVFSINFWFGPPKGALYNDCTLYIDNIYLTSTPDGEVSVKKRF